MKTDTIKSLARPRILPRIALGIGVLLIIIAFFVFRFSTNAALIGAWNGPIFSSNSSQTATAFYDFTSNGTVRIKAQLFGSSVDIENSYLTFGPYLILKSSPVTISSGSQEYTMPTVCRYARTGNSLTLTEWRGTRKVVLTKSP